MKRTLLITISALLVGCSSPQADSPQGVDVQTRTVVLTPSQNDLDYADEASPSDPELARLYDRSCMSCHSVDGAGAPLTGHVAEWQARVSKKGIAGLLKSTKEGKGGMPAMGMCRDCTDAEFIQLIEYMARKE